MAKCLCGNSSQYWKYVILVMYRIIEGLRVVLNPLVLVKKFCVLIFVIVVIYFSLDTITSIKIYWELLYV